MKLWKSLLQWEWFLTLEGCSIKHIGEEEYIRNPHTVMKEENETLFKRCILYEIGDE